MEKVEQIYYCRYWGHAKVENCYSGFVPHLLLYKKTCPLVAYKYSGPVMGLSAPNQESISGLFGPLDH